MSGIQLLLFFIIYTFAMFAFGYVVGMTVMIKKKGKDENKGKFAN